MPLPLILEAVGQRAWFLRALRGEGELFMSTTIQGLESNVSQNINLINLIERTCLALKRMAQAGKTPFDKLRLRPGIMCAMMSIKRGRCTLRENSTHGVPGACKHYKHT